MHDDDTEALPPATGREVDLRTRLLRVRRRLVRIREDLEGAAEEFYAIGFTPPPPGWHAPEAILVRALWSAVFLLSVAMKHVVGELDARVSPRDEE